MAMANECGEEEKKGAIFVFASLRRGIGLKLTETALFLFEIDV